MTIFHTGLTPEQAMLERFRITYARLDKELNEIRACLQAQDPHTRSSGRKYDSSSRTTSTSGSKKPDW